jgi:membrane protein DedA with SNARE-associated domain
LIGDLVEQILDLGAAPICALVSVLAMLETAAFAGLAVPGELTVVVGGVAASRGNVPLAAVAAAAVIGAIVGDSAGFYLGRKLGVRFLDGRLGRLMGRSRVEATMGRIRAGGIKVVILGRFIGVLRAIMPFAAGASGMRYARFVVASVIGATSWGIGFTVLGYFAGNSWRKVEHYAGAASKVLFVLLVLVVLVVVLTRKAIERQDRIRARWARFLARPRVAAFRQRYRRQIGFAARRFSPASAAGLQLTLSLIGLSVVGYLLALLVGPALGGDGLLDVDQPLAEAIAESQAPWLRDVMAVVAALVAPLSVWVIALVTGAGAWLRDRTPRAFVLLVAAAGGATAMVEAVQAVIAESRDLPGAQFGRVVTATFPNARITVAAALVVALVAVGTPRVRRWRSKVAVVALLGSTLVLASIALIYLARSFFSDLVGGIALGTLWGWTVATAVSIVWRPPAARQRVPAPELASDVDGSA